MRVNPKYPVGAQWVWEIKIDGYRAEVMKFDGDLFLPNGGRNR